VLACTRRCSLITLPTFFKNEVRHPLLLHYEVERWSTIKDIGRRYFVLDLGPFKKLRIPIWGEQVWPRWKKSEVTRSVYSSIAKSPLLSWGMTTYTLMTLSYSCSRAIDIQEVESIVQSWFSIRKLPQLSFALCHVPCCAWGRGWERVLGVRDHYDFTTFSEAVSSVFGSNSIFFHFNSHYVHPFIVIGEQWQNR
jgi:hypothetical protein